MPVRFNNALSFILSLRWHFPARGIGMRLYRLHYGKFRVLSTVRTMTTYLTALPALLAFEFHVDITTGLTKFRNYMGFWAFATFLI